MPLWVFLSITNAALRWYFRVICSETSLWSFLKFSLFLGKLESEGSCSAIEPCFFHTSIHWWFTFLYKIQLYPELSVPSFSFFISNPPQGLKNYSHSVDHLRCRFRHLQMKDQSVRSMGPNHLIYILSCLHKKLRSRNCYPTIPPRSRPFKS